MDHLSLLADGREHTRAEWEKAAADVLRKGGRMGTDDPDALVWDKLTRTTLDGVPVPPLGTSASVADLPAPGQPGLAPFTRGSAATRSEEGWDIRVHVADPEVARSAADVVTDLENGATSLWIALGRGGLAVADLPTVLAEVHLDLAAVVLDAPDQPVAAAEALCDLLRRRQVTPAAGTSLGGDPLGTRVRAWEDEAEVETTVLRLADLAREHGVLALCVDGTAVHDAGATDAQELGYTLAAGAAYLRLLTGPGGLDPVAAAALLEFRYAATDEQFPTIAKLRAARRAWHRVLELCDAGNAPGQVQHAVTSRPMMTRYDPWVNMLRGTVAAFSAGVGGATSVTVLPFDSKLGLPDALARRNARNTSSLLVHEAQVARVVDPGGGSYALERLTEDLAAAGWAEFQRIEAEGGVLTSIGLEQGGLRDRIETRGRGPRARQVALRRRAVTGVSEFPHLHESLPERRPHPPGALLPQVEGYGAAFEAMRDDPPADPVFLATLGPVAAHTARATFAGNLLGAGGVDVVAAGATSGTEDLVAAYAGQRVVCLAGSDGAYAEWGAAAAEALRAAGARYVVVAGDPADLPVDDSCATGVDALAFLGRIRRELAS